MKPNPKKAAEVIAKFHGIEKALEVNAGAIALADQAKDKEAVRVLSQVQAELHKLVDTED